MTDHSQPCSVGTATPADLRARGVDPASNALAALAVKLAGEIDDEPDSKALAALAREFRAAMVEVAKAAPPTPVRDDVDDLRARREARRRGA